KMKDSGKLVELVSGKPAWELLPSRVWTWYGTTIQNAKLGDLSGAQVLIGGLDTNDGNDVMMGSSGADRFYTGGGDDTVVGDFGRLAFEARGELKDGDASQAQSSANGGGGNDTVVGLNGNHVVLGGLGQDTITLGNGNNLVLGDLGSFTLKSDTRLTLTAQTSVGNSFDEAGGADTITLGTGSNVVIAGAGADRVTINDAAASRNVVLGDSGQVVFGTAKKDAHLLQSVEAQVRETTGADDIISLQSGNAVLAGGAGADVITVSAAASTAANYRYVTGDHAIFRFDTLGGLTDLLTTDVADATGGNDKVTIASSGMSSNIGLNMVIAGMGSDTVLVSAEIDPVTGEIRRGTATSQDILLGDNGEIHRTAADASNGQRNLMLQVKSTVNDKGGNDILASGDGGKVLLGGFGADTLYARDGAQLVVGDNGELNYDSVARNGILREMQSTDPVIGGADRILLRDGIKHVIGGIGADVIDIDASGLPQSANPATVTGLDLQDNLAGSQGRFVAGDNARFSYDTRSGLTDVVTTDAITATGGDDVISLGQKDLATNLGLQVVFGGMGADQIVVRSVARSQDILFGDNGELRRKPLGYGVLSASSLATSLGGDDQIRTGKGDKLIVGGFGNDRIVAETVREGSAVERVLALGDSGRVVFDAAGGQQLQKLESTDIGFGGDDQITLGDGDITVVAGYGRDVVQVNSSENAFRTLVGDNAQLLFSGESDAARQAASLLSVLTLDQTAVTGGGDTLQIGTTGAIAGELGEAQLVGGMGEDVLSVYGASVNAVLLGDNGQIQRNSGRNQALLSVGSLLPEQGAGDTLTLTHGEHVVIAGQGADKVTAGKGFGVVLGDSGNVSFGSSGKLASVSSSGIAQGGNDVLQLGVGVSAIDGDKVVVGGFGADTISVQSQRGTASLASERAVAGDNASMIFDIAGRLTSFGTLDSDPSTGGNDDITVSMTGDAIAGVMADFNIVAGGMGSDRINVLGSVLSRDVVSGDNLDYRRSGAATGYQHLFAESSQPQSGGDDSIRVGSGDKLLFGGAGNDKVESLTVSGDRNIAFGDAGSVSFAVDGSGKLVRVGTQSDSSGGDDILNIGAGTAYVFGGFGRDALTLSGGDAAMRVVAGDGAQANFDATGALQLVQSTGSDAADPLLTSDSFVLPNTGRNIVLGGTGVDTLAGSVELDAAKPQHSIIPGSGLADLVRQIVSVVMLGEYGEMGVTTTGYVKPQNGSGGGVVVGDLDGKASLTEDSNTRASGRIAYPALSGGVASFDPASNTQQGRFGKLEVKVDGSWSYTLGNDSASNARVQALRDGDVRSEVFVLTTTDGSQTTVTLTINGSNDQPQAQLSSLVEDGATTSSGRLQDSLAGLASVFLPGSFVGELGTLQLSSDGAWQFALSANVQALAAGSSRRESFTVQTVDGATSTLTVEIIGVNDAAVISGQQSGSVAQDGAHSSSGQLQISDIDNGEAQFQAGSQAGSYGALQLDASGSWTYTLSNGAAVAKGQTVVEQFTVLAKDGTSSTVSISVTGGNHAAVIGGQQSGAVAKDGQQQASGQLSIRDADAGEAVFVAQTLAGQHGSFSLQADGSWAYQLQDGSSIAKGVTVQESFQVQSADGSRSTVVIAVTGGNHAASVSGQLAGAVAQDGQRSSSGQLLVNDIDAGEAVFVAATSQGKYGQLQLQADGSWVYQLQDGSSIAKGATSQESFTVRTAEG
ncbi:MAG: VCBS domain-containing protein, partial [Vogesella sp.]|nr:VCBS domain-containing protein [Vogesella sp.]